jgi:hypothetical protein
MNMQSLTRLASRPALPWLLLALGATGCVPDFDDDLSRITEPQLLSLRATPAELKEAGETSLEALVAVPDGQAAPPVKFGLCLARKPLTQLGPINQDCLQPNAPANVLVPLGTGHGVNLKLPEDACRLFGPLQPAAEAGKPAGRPVDPDVTGGFYQPFVARLGAQVSVGAVRIDCDLSAAGRDESVKYRQQYRTNENPVLSRVTLSGDADLDETATTRLKAGDSVAFDAAWEACPTSSSCGDGFCTANEDQTSCAEDCLTPRGCSGSERYVSYDPEKQTVIGRREGITVAWFASRGRFQNEQTGFSEAEAANATATQNTWSPGSAPGPATVWLVIRDTRGGQSWKSFHFEVAP